LTGNGKDVPPELRACAAGRYASKPSRNQGASPCRLEAVIEAALESYGKPASATPSTREITDAADAVEGHPHRRVIADIVQPITYLNERNPTAAAKVDAEIGRCVER
jgi:hypothetical protein